MKVNKQVFNEQTKEWEIVVTEKIREPKDIDKESVQRLEFQQYNIQRELEQLDKKINKYRDQEDMVKLELLEQTDLTFAEYKDLLVLKQTKRLQHRQLQDEIDIIKQNWGWE